MAYDKIQVEFYSNLGGINEKASEYITGDGFFLNLRNYGFERPGALVSRPGTTDHASLPFATFLSHPRFIANYEFQDFGVGGSFLAFDSGSGLYGLSSSPALYNNSLTSGATVSYPIDYTLAKNRLYVANGQVLFHLGLTAATKYSIPIGQSFFSGGGFTVYPDNSPGITVAIPSGTFALTYGYARQIQGTSLFEYGQRYAGPTFLFKHNAATLVGKTPVYDATRLRGAPDGYGASFFSIYIAPPGGTFAFVDIYPILLDSGMQVANGLYHFPAEPDVIPLFTLAPQHLEQYKNMLFMSGFSTTPSTIWHTELGDAEHVEPSNFIEVRTDNGDAITCLKSFQNTLVVFKSRSVHELNGESPETLSLKDVSLEYGCVNNEAAVVFENKLWFVDKRGICEYNGPNTFIVSAAVERTFQTLDTSKARAVHVKKRTEVWFCFGGTTLVYDYRAQAWTIYDGVSVEHGKGAELLEYGSSLFDLSYFIQGTSHYPLVRFKDDVYTDRGVAISLLAQAPFIKRMGDSTQEMFRRFYLDADVPGVTTGATLRLKPDYGTSIYSAYGFYLDSFQKKTEFGISAKSLSVEWVINATTQITINGYAIHARFLRSV